MGYYAACSDNSLLTFQDNLSVEGFLALGIGTNRLS